MNSNFQILTRRGFLSRGAKLAAAAAFSTLTDVPFVLKRALAEGSIGLPGTGGRVKKLLFLFLRGGNDGLNSVIPMGDSAYWNSAQNVSSIRPTLAIRPNIQDSAWRWDRKGPALWTPSGKQPTYGDFAIPLGNEFAALHPALKFLAPVYNSGGLALVHRVAYPRQSRSHFDSQNYWETGTPRDNGTSEGLFYRAMVESGLANVSPLTGVSIQSSLPLILRGSKAAMTNLSNPDRYDLLGVPNTAPGNKKSSSFLQAANQLEFAEKRDRELLRLQYGNMSQTLEIFQTLINGDFKKQFLDNEDTDGDRPYDLFPSSNETNGGWVRARSAAGAVTETDANKYVVPAGDYSFFQNLKAAAVILNKTDAIVAGTQLDGFDTHSVQGGATGAQANLLRRVGWSIYALRKYFSAYSDRCRWEDVAVVTLSEFGRTTKENDDRGTDHAEATVMWVAGGSVKGYVAGVGGRSGVFNCGINDPVPWQDGPTGSMFGVDKRYLKRATDYRSVLGEVIRNHLGATQSQLDRIIPGYTVAGEALRTGGVQTKDGTAVTGELGLI